MKRKIITSIILFIVISLCMTFTKADNTIDVNNLDDKRFNTVKFRR